MDTVKTEMTRYWSRRVEKFSNLRQLEFACEKHKQWMAELNRYLSGKGKLHILDIGTGTGFFAFLLAEKGHFVTGIDLTPGMITEARRIRDRLGLSVDFYTMDAEHPDFPLQSFDAIVTRKLTWALPNLPQTYKNWQKLLKPGGVLVNFDADYCREAPAESLPECHAHQDVEPELMEAYEGMKQALLPTQRPRPHWDIELLRQAGFSNITVDPGVWQRVYTKTDTFYDPVPGFALSATA